MSYVLGLDLSLTATGRAAVPGPTAAFGTPITATIKTHPTGDTYDARWIRIHIAATQIIPTETPDLAVIEGPSYGSGSTRRESGVHDRAGLWWAVYSRLTDAGIPVAVVAPATRAKWATGRGNAGKSEVAVAVARLWPDHDARTDDEWDALALATMGAQWLGWDMPRRAHHALTLAAVTWPTTREPATPQHPAQAG